MHGYTHLHGNEGMVHGIGTMSRIMKLLDATMLSPSSTSVYVQRNCVTSGALTIASLGWSREKAAAVRASLASFASGWDDPDMDIYDEL